MIDDDSPGGGAAHLGITESTVAIDLLKREHRAIERVLVSIDVIVDVVRAGAEVPPFFELILQFIGSCADDRHHAKEEGILFETMVAHGMPGRAGPIGCMLNEHMLLRGLSRRMAESLRAVRRGEQPSIDSLIAAAALYVRTLAQHIVKEDRMLYPLAERMLPPSAFEGMLARYAEKDPEGIVVFEAAAREIERLTMMCASAARTIHSAASCRISRRE